MFLRDIFCYVVKSYLVIFSVILTSFLRDIFCYIDECSFVIFSVMLTSVPSYSVISTSVPP